MIVVMIDAGADIELEGIRKRVGSVPEARVLPVRGRGVGVEPVRCRGRRKRSEVHVRGVIGCRAVELPQGVEVAEIQPCHPAERAFVG